MVINYHTHVQSGATFDTSSNKYIYNYFTVQLIVLFLYLTVSGG